MKILVTGAGGNLGQSLQKALTNYDLHFLALTRTELDITDQQAIIDITKNYRPDIIINTAAYTQVEAAETSPVLAFKINCDGAKNVAYAARMIQAPIFHLSTDYVFSGEASEPYAENSPTNPKTVYGQSKLAGEQAVAEINPRHIILRTSWLFSEYGNNFLRTMLRLGKEKTSLSIVMDQLGAPTYAGDLSLALIQLIRRYKYHQEQPWGIYHYSGTPYTSWYEFAIFIFQQASTQGIYNSTAPTINPIHSRDYPSIVKRPLNSQLDCRKIQTAFGIAPSNWQAALKNLRDFL